MTYAANVIKAILRRANRLMDSREPDRIIGGEEDAYMKRWFVIPRNRIFNIYLHRFLRSDDDRALHDHPWVNMSILLEGEYTEHTIKAGGINDRVIRKSGAFKVRGPRSAHRIELHNGPVTMVRSRRCLLLARMSDLGVFIAPTVGVIGENSLRVRMVKLLDEVATDDPQRTTHLPPKRQKE